MKLGLFCMPNHPPERTPYDAAQWNLQVFKWGDELGFTEAWIGEHYSSAWEPVPSPDLLIAQALRETKKMKFAPGAHLLPYHNPVELAYRIAYLDHLAQGRYMLGVGAGAFEIDATLFASGGKNHEMMEEALDIILKIWAADGPTEYNGKYWSFKYPEYDEVFKGPYMKPFQKPHPPIGLAGFSPRSGTIKQAGARGFLPLSLNLSASYLAGHWEAYEEGAATNPAVKPDRNDWRVGREIFVADTDEAAYDAVVNGMMGRSQREYMLPLYKRFGMTRIVVPDESVAEADVTPEYMAKNVWLVGSPDTVARKLREQYEAAGGWGTMLALTYDYADQPQLWRRSMELMATEVLPRVADLQLSPQAV